MLFLCVKSSILPMPPINGLSILIGTTTSSIVTNNVVQSSSISSDVWAIYIMSWITIIGAIIAFILIRFKFVFDSRNLTWASVQWLSVNLLSVILISIEIFTQSITSPIYFGVDNPTILKAGWMFNYYVKENVVEFSYSSFAVTFIVFQAIELFIMLGYWLYFTFKIIKKKYIQ